MQPAGVTTPRWPPTAVFVGVCLAALALIGPATAAYGHASGEVPRAELRAEGNAVHIDFLAPADDAAVIGTSLGLLGEGAMAALLGGSQEDLPTDEQIATLSSSPALRDYLQEHVSVLQDGVPCPGQAHPAPDFLSDGARLEFRCPAVVEQADVRITVLHDEDPAYRTFSVDGTIQYAIHSAAAPEHTWDFTLAEADSGGVDPLLVAAAAIVAVVLIGTIVVIGPRRRVREAA